MSEPVETAEVIEATPVADLTGESTEATEEAAPAEGEE